MASTDGFFNRPTEQSTIKIAIVEKFFDAWSKVITGAQNRRPGPHRIRYVDLYAGPGRYDDGSTSTPLRVLAKATATSLVAERLVAVLNDKNPENARRLREEVDALPDVGKLRYRPQVWNEAVTPELAARFPKGIPTLSFLDPWGYKGLSLDLIKTLAADWGSDCIFFFNYRRIRPALNNPLFQEHMAALFGPARAQRLREVLSQDLPEDPEATILDDLSAAFQEFGQPKRYVLTFGFHSGSGTAGHHLVFLSKDFKGYEIMKEILGKLSSEALQGVPSFCYEPLQVVTGQQVLFGPRDELRDELLRDYAGKKRTVREIWREHSVGRRYLARNYRAVLTELYRDGIIDAKPQPKPGTFGDNLEVIFPPPRLGH